MDKSMLYKDTIMDSRLLRIGNTILCNYGMVDNNGLLYGRMGVCIFLYEYARYTGIKEYEDIADEMIDSLLKTTRKVKNEENFSIVAGIGVGVIYLITHGFLEDTDDSDALEEIDDLLFEAIRTAEELSDMVIYASLYFIYRFLHYRTNVDNALCRLLAEKLVTLFRKDTTRDNPHLLRRLIPRKLERIIRCLKGENSRENDDEPILHEICCDMKSDVDAAKRFWYRSLLGEETDNVVELEPELDILDLSRNCFDLYG